MKNFASSFHLSRRDFVKRSAAFFCGSMLAGCSSLRWAQLSMQKDGASGQEWIVFPSDPVLTKNGESQLFVYQQATAQIEAISIPLRLAHSCISNPVNSDQVFVFEQFGPLACEVNLRHKTVKPFRLDGEGHFFYGHGAFSQDGKFVLTTEVHGQQGEGKIVLRRAIDFHALDVIPSYGYIPHELKFIKNDAILVVANHGGETGEIPKKLGSSISYIDLQSKKLLKQVMIDEPDVSASHFEVLDDDVLLVACRRMLKKKDPQSLAMREKWKNPATRASVANEMWRTTEYLEAPLYWIKNGDLLSKVDSAMLSGKLRNSLSLAYARRLGVVAVTHLEGQMVSFWNTHSRQLIKSLDFGSDGPHGICYLEKENAFVVGGVNGLVFVDGHTLTRRSEVFPAAFGVHMSKLRSY